MDSVVMKFDDEAAPVNGTGEGVGEIKCRLVVDVRYTGVRRGVFEKC
jgi:hypothetical protein